MADRLARNPTLLCLIRAMQMALFPMAILSVFLQREIGFGVAEIMLLQAVFGVAMVLFEFPSGYLADRIGYRRCLILAFALWTIAWPIYGQAQGWLGVASAELLLGVGMALISGCDTALLYESLLAKQREHTFMRWDGRLTFSGQLAEGLAALAAGLMFASSTALPFWAQGLASALALWRSRWSSPSASGRASPTASRRSARWSVMSWSRAPSCGRCSPPRWCSASPRSCRSGPFSCMRSTLASRSRGWARCGRSPTSRSRSRRCSATACSARARWAWWSACAPR